MSISALGRKRPTEVKSALSAKKSAEEPKESTEDIVDELIYAAPEVDVQDFVSRAMWFMRKNGTIIRAPSDVNAAISFLSKMPINRNGEANLKILRAISQQEKYFGNLGDNYR